MSSQPRVMPAAVVQQVESYVDDELAQARKYDNRQPLDESGVHTLHRLAAQVYAAGWADGEAAQAERDRGQRRRERNA